MTTKKTTNKRKSAKTAEAAPVEAAVAADQPLVQEPVATIATDHEASVTAPAVAHATAAKSPAPQGVRPGKTAPYHAGTVIKKHGMQAGVTPEMCKELCDILGHDDPTAEKAVLAWAWHVINGYQASDSSR